MVKVALADVKPGDILIADAGFTCMFEAEHVTVAADEDGRLYVNCADGRHLLDGQTDAEGYLIGLTRREGEGW